jgi:cell division septation protein DedD
VVEADGLYYIALRNRGVDRIVLQGSLEPGMYDLSLSENFGPMDREAEGYRTWARLYITGASFWEIDWSRVVEIFSQIYPSLPNLRDGSGWTAVERFRLASIGYGDQLMAKNEYCKGRDQYVNALSISEDPKLAPTAAAAQLLCSPPTPTSKPATKTPKATQSEPQPTPADEITPAPTPGGTPPVN